MAKNKKKQPVQIDGYFQSIAEQLHLQSKQIQAIPHNLTAGENQEEIVSKLLRDYLPAFVEVDTGIILSSSGEFSNQADIIIADRLNNLSLYPHLTKKVWLVESVYGMIEVKTTLTRKELKDSINKSKRFKQLKRKFNPQQSPKNKESLFILWAFNSSKEIAKTIKEVYNKEKDKKSLPDIIIISGSYIVRGGQYYITSEIGQEGSECRKGKLQEEVDKVCEKGFEIWEIENNNALLIVLIWITSWLQCAGSRKVDLNAYLPQQTWGKIV